MQISNISKTLYLHHINMQCYVYIIVQQMTSRTHLLTSRNDFIQKKHLYCFFKNYTQDKLRK